MEIVFQASRVPPSAEEQAARLTLSAREPCWKLKFGVPLWGTLISPSCGSRVDRTLTNVGRGTALTTRRPLGTNLFSFLWNLDDYSAGMGEEGFHLRTPSPPHFPVQHPAQLQIFYCYSTLNMTRLPKLNTDSCTSKVIWFYLQSFSFSYGSVINQEKIGVINRILKFWSCKYQFLWAVPTTSLKLTWP